MCPWRPIRVGRLLSANFEFLPPRDALLSELPVPSKALPKGWLPLAHLNLWRNPFGELTRDERAELAIVSDDELVRYDVGERKAVQLIGDCGRGKTTRMLAMHCRYPNSSYVYLPEDEPCPPIPDGFPLLIDEAQRLPRRVIRSLFSTGIPLVLATHNDLEKVLGRFGYTVQTIAIGDQNTPEHISRVLNRRIEASRLGPGPLPEVSMHEATSLHRSFGGDLRAIEQFLYERIQTLVIYHGEMRFND